MRLALVGLVLLAVGCQGQLNPTYCATHREDPDCLTVGVELLDAPAGPECTSDPDCVGNAAGAVCDTVDGQCVQCVVSASCPVPQVCGPDQMCHGCITDDDCMNSSEVCLASKMCATEGDVLYANPMGSGSTCSRATPCTFTTATQQLTMSRHIIKLLVVPGMDFTDRPITIDQGYDVQIIGVGVKFVPENDDDPEDAITASGMKLEILGLTIDGASSNGVRCTAGALTLQNVTITSSNRYSVRSSDCNLTVKRSRFSGVAGSGPDVGAIYALRGTHEIINNIIHDIGGNDLEYGAIRLLDASGGRVAFNTIARITSRSGGNRVGGVYCTEAAGGAFTVTQNVVTAWGVAQEAFGPDPDDQTRCAFPDNFSDHNIDLVRFGQDFHLTDQSPPESIRNVSTMAMQTECSKTNVYIDDFDGQQRPFDFFCDRGADEHRPP